jgi:asparagine synthase (glutamine-hydrolysing)
MSGFLGIIDKTKKLQRQQMDLNFGSFEKYLSQKKITSENLTTYIFTNQKFEKDKIFFQDDDYIIVIDGVILNWRQLIQTYAISNTVDLVRYLYRQRGDTFFSEFRGEFCGLLYDKKAESYVIFTNQTATKRLFYYHENDVIIFSSDLKCIIQTLKTNQLAYNLDEIGAYFLLTYGYMLEEYTTVREIKKLKAGYYLKIDNSTLTRLNYHRFEIAHITSDPKEKIISTLDELFCNALKQEYEKDDEYGYKHIATLSAGLDSRMNVMVSHKLGFIDKLIITFSRINYFDESIPKKITDDLNEEFLFYALDNTKFLKNISDVVWLNDGLILYSGSAHFFNMTNKLNFDDFGLIHTGMLGDMVMGSFYKKPKLEQVDIAAGFYSSKLLPVIDERIRYIEKEYETEESFVLYCRGFNGSNNSYWINECFTYQTSPFLNVEFLEYCQTLPIKYKYKEQIYIEWILAKYPEVAKYIWEKQGTKLTDSTMLLMANKALYKIKNYARKTLHPTKWIPLNMNPFDFWYQSKPELKDFITNYFNEHIDILDDYKQLKADTINLFTTGKFEEKAQAITLIESVRQFIK